MADERDANVSKRYRELGAEEPPRALDEAILAASRRAAESRPAPLVVPAGRRRWYFPVAAAAVIMLAVAVTVQIERRKPEDELIASAPPQAQKEEQLFKAPASPEQPKPAPKPLRAPQPFTPEPPPPAAAPPSADAMRDLAKSNEATTAAQRARPAEVRSRTDAVQERAASAPAPAPAPARRAMEAPRSEVSPAMGAVAARIMQSPEAWLEQIAELRKQGKHEEADKALAEFRKRYPDYRLTDEMRAKVEKK